MEQVVFLYILQNVLTVVFVVIACGYLLLYKERGTSINEKVSNDPPDRFLTQKSRALHTMEELKTLRAVKAYGRQQI